MIILLYFSVSDYYTCPLCPQQDSKSPTHNLCVFLHITYDSCATISVMYNIILWGLTRYSRRSIVNSLIFHNHKEYNIIYIFTGTIVRVIESHTKRLAFLRLRKYIINRVNSYDILFEENKIVQIYISALIPVQHMI